MPSFGEGLKREREKKKITLDQIAVSTKISVRMLRAIEEEKFDQLPGGIFNKAFVRAYARQLGLDEEQIVADYLAIFAPETPAAQPEDLELRAMAEQKQKERQRQARLAKDFPWSWVATVLLLIALGFSIWGIRSSRDGQSAGAVPSTPATTSATPSPRADQSSVTVKEQPAAKPEAPPGARLSATAKDGSSHYATAVAPEDSKAPASGENKSFAVLVTAQENSWLSITADGKIIFSGTLIAPGSQLIRANDSIVIRAGNVGGLDFDFNGKRLAAQGEEGEVKTLTFHREGLAPVTAETVGSPE